MIYRLYGMTHKFAKYVLKRGTNSNFRMVDLNEKYVGELEENTFFNNTYLRKGQITITKDEGFPVENITSKGNMLKLEDSFSKKKSHHKWSAGKWDSVDKWYDFILNSKIPDGYKNGGLCYAGYILDCNSWCLPSWIWTNAAIVRTLCSLNKLNDAKKMVDILIDLQQECGGWIVRNDYTSSGMIPMLAPNDSAYIANNACLTIYKATKIDKYLQSAEKCAMWIIDTAREDGLVWLGMNAQTKKWITDHNIVDIGFTAGLFAALYEITNKQIYKEFLEKFIQTYIRLFRKNDGSFSTGLNQNDGQQGGAFGRGQGWALEGLIPAYNILKTQELKNIIDKLVLQIVRSQDASGGWPYNFERKLLGLDCKATSVLAVDILRWFSNSNYQSEILSCAQKALKWCEKRTINDGTEATGGIFSYTMEGAIVHHLYTSTAFVYSSAYAIELHMLLEKLRKYET